MAFPLPVAGTHCLDNILGDIGAGGDENVDVTVFKKPVDDFPLTRRGERTGIPHKDSDLFVLYHLFEDIDRFGQFSSLESCS